MRLPTISDFELLEITIRWPPPCSCTSHPRFLSLGGPGLGRKQVPVSCLLAHSSVLAVLVAWCTRHRKMDNLSWPDCGPHTSHPLLGCDSILHPSLLAGVAQSLKDDTALLLMTNTSNFPLFWRDPFLFNA